MKCVLLLLSILASPAHAEDLKVGSKRFTESYILGEVLARTAGEAAHRQGLGNTGIVFAALKSGAIDLYPDYTGTIAKEILKLEGAAGLEEINRGLAPMGIAASVPLGFSNGYALAMREEGRDFAWKRVFGYPAQSHVRFNHAPHIRAKVECSTCHGNIASQRTAQRNVDMTMGFCVNCHRERKAPDDCLTCHF